MGVFELPLSRATKPRSTPDWAANSHNHVEIVTTAKGRVDQLHPAGGTHGIRIDAAETGNLCQHRPIAGSTPDNPALVFLATPISPHT